MNQLNQKIELMSHPLCPHNQRAVLALMKKGMVRGEGFSVDYLDLANLPERLFRLSAKGQMPVLAIDGRAVSTDSTHIVQFIDEAFPDPKMSPDGVAARMVDCEIMAKADAALELMRLVYTAKTDSTLAEAVGKYFAGMQEIQSSIPVWFFDRSQRIFSLADAAWAGFFSLAFNFEKFRNEQAWKEMPKFYAYGESLMTDDDVKDSRCPNYDAEFAHFFGIFDSEFPRRFGTSN